MKNMIKTFIGYDKEGKRVKGYAMKNYNFEELKNYMTLAEFEKIEYIQELKWDSKTTKDENGLYKPLNEWKYANTVKHYIHI